jgi:hypothetical protein
LDVLRRSSLLYQYHLIRHTVKSFRPVFFSALMISR